MTETLAMLPSNVDQYAAAYGHTHPNMVDHQQHQHHHHHHHQLDSQQLAPSPLDSLAHASPYSTLAYHQNRHVLPNSKAFIKPHRLPYPAGPIAPRSQHDRPGRSSAASGPVRRRISRACDQCNQLRTKCDGKIPPQNPPLGNMN